MRKNPFKAMLEISDPKTNDVLGAYPEKVHVRAFPERRYLKTARSLAIFSMVSLLLTIALASIVYILAPQKTADISLITKDSQINGLKYVEGRDAYTTSEYLYYEKFVQDYVILRHEVDSDIDILTQKYDEPDSKLNLLSSNFERNTIKADLVATKNMVIEDGLTRKVNVLWARKQVERRNKDGQLVDICYLVRFQTLDFHHGKPANEIKEWEAFMRIGINGKAKDKVLNVDLSKSDDIKRRVSYAEKNPLFLVVDNYVLAYAGSKPLPPPNRR